MLNLINITARNLPDAWFQLVYKAVEIGRGFEIDRGSYEGMKRLEFDYVTIQVKFPGEEPLVPVMPERVTFPPPTDMDFVNNYLPYLMDSIKLPNESYTYGSRIAGYITPHAILYRMVTWQQHIVDELEEWMQNPKIISTVDRLFNQIEAVIWTYKNKGHRNNQMVLQVAEPNDLLLKDPPCLRHIDTRVQDGKLHFFVYFRSWDLWNGLSPNLAGVQLLKQYIAMEIGVDDGELIASSKGLHIYNDCWPMAEELRNKKIEGI